jgi:hypothetical protein
VGLENLDDTSAHGAEAEHADLDVCHGWSGWPARAG